MLPPHPLSAGRARKHVQRALQRSGHADLSEVAQLLVSELVSNVVLHARTELVLIVQAAGGTVRVEVRDQSPSEARRRRHGLRSTTGRGLQLVEGFATRWGSAAEGGGKTVWFELDRSSA